jgi:hypothetical protein
MVTEEKNKREISPIYFKKYKNIINKLVQTMDSNMHARGFKYAIATL